MGLIKLRIQYKRAKEVLQGDSEKRSQAQQAASLNRRLWKKCLQVDEIFILLDVSNYIMGRFSFWGRFGVELAIINRKEIRQF